MKQNTFSITLVEAAEELGEPESREDHAKRDTTQAVISWGCGCEFHETENGSGILFSCEQHAQ